MSHQKPQIDRGVLIGLLSFVFIDGLFNVTVTINPFAMILWSFVLCLFSMLLNNWASKKKDD